MALRSETAFQPRTSAPDAVLRYLQDKELQPGFDWREVWQEEHALAFTVAKIMAKDVLGDVKASLEQALENGETFESWSKRISEVLASAGWAGERDVTNPETGEVATTNITAPRRLRTIWQANMRTARAAGQWDRAQRSKRLMPFFLYQLGPSEVHRPHHADKVGLILPVDDPFWEKWFPPNGWGCKCWLRQISTAEAERLGYTGAAAPNVLELVYDNPATGERSRIPQGIDPGWASNPGRARAQLLEDRLAA